MRLLDDEVIFARIGQTWTYNNEGQRNELGEYLFHILKKRLHKPTENNDESSRTHILISMSFYPDNEYIEEHCQRIIVGDLAGVENEFACNLESLLEINENYEEKKNWSRILK